MGFSVWVTVFVICFIGLSTAAEPDWSCDFEADDCGFIKTQGKWTRTVLNGNGELQANVTNESRVGDMFIISIPYNFTSPIGNVSFGYFLAGPDATLQVTVCRGQSEPSFMLHVLTGDALLDDTTVIPYSCPNKMDVEIVFNASRGEVAPLIKLDNIQIYETPYHAYTDWSCDFEVDDCGFIELQGTWTRRVFNGNGELYANIPDKSRTGDMFIISIPYDFTSPIGNVSFGYYLAGIDTTLQVTVCRGQSEPVLFLRVPTQAPIDMLQDPTLIPYLCANKMDVEIVFNATRSSVSPLIRLDNIQIFETPYTEVSTPMTTVLPGTPTITTQPPTNIQALQTSTEMVTHGASRTGEQTITEDVTDVPPLPQLSWLIPVAVTMSVLFVITLVILVILIHCYRQSLKKGSSRGTAPQTMALGPETRESDPTTPGTQPVAFSSPMHTNMVSTEHHYTGLVNPDQPHPYSELSVGPSEMLSYSKERVETDEYGYEIPIVNGRGVMERDPITPTGYVNLNSGVAFQSHEDYDDAISAPAAGN